MSVCRSVGPKKNVRTLGKCGLLLLLLKNPSPPPAQMLDKQIRNNFERQWLRSLTTHKHL